MRKTLSIVVSVVIFSLMTAFCLKAAGEFLEKRDADVKYEQFFQADTNFDVIFMGTSHVYNTVMPQELWRSAHIMSYNFASPNCSIPMDYYLLQMLCKYTDPKLLVLDLFGMVEFGNSDQAKYRPGTRDQMRVQFDAFPLSRTKIKAAEDVFDDYDDRWDFLFNLAIYHNRWSSINQSYFHPEPRPEKGAEFVLGTVPAEYEETADGRIIDLNSPGISYISKIVDYCREENIKVLFTYMPFVAWQECFDAASSLEHILLQYPDCKYLNMLNLGIINYQTDVYTDGSHLNYIGAVTVTDWLGQYIAEHYPETVCSSQADALLWDNDYYGYWEYLTTKFSSDAFYENLQLLYGENFCGEIVASEDVINTLNDDSQFVEYRKRLQDHLNVTCTEGANESTNSLVLAITKRHSDEPVLQIEFSSDAVLKKQSKNA